MARRPLEARPGLFPGEGELFVNWRKAFPTRRPQDQSKAIADVLGDLCAEQPMDRLVCGDVGYGRLRWQYGLLSRPLEDRVPGSLVGPPTTVVCGTTLVAPFKRPVRRNFPGPRPLVSGPGPGPPGTRGGKNSRGGEEGQGAWCLGPPGLFQEGGPPGGGPGGGKTLGGPPRK